VQCLTALCDGVVVEWPVGAPSSAEGWVAPAPGEAITARFTPGCFVGDQPATDTFNGNGKHGAAMGCRWGSVVNKCVGSTLAADSKDLGFDVSKLESIVKKKGISVPDWNTVTWHRATESVMAEQATVVASPDAVKAAQEAAANLELSHTARKELVKASGWSFIGHFARMLHELNGFDQQKDVLIDAMHNWMNVIKPLCHMTVDIVRVENAEYWLDRLLQEIRQMLPGAFTSGRRVSTFTGLGYRYV
jgi:hypothetical protein